MHAESYIEEELAYNEYTEKAVKKALRTIKKEVDQDKLNILDVGCGPGGHLSLFEEVFDEVKVTGIDLSEKHVHYAEKVSDKADINAEMVLADINKDCSLEEKFDVVWCADVLSLNTVKIERLVGNLKENLTKDSLFVVFNGNWLQQEVMQEYQSIESEIRAIRAKKYKNSGNNFFSEVLDQLRYEFSEVRLHQFPVTIEKEELSGKTLKYLRNTFKKYRKIAQKSDRLKEEELALLEDIMEESSENFLLEKPGYYARINPLMVVARVSK